MNRLILLLCCFLFWNKGLTAVNTDKLLKKIDRFNTAGNTDSAAFYFSVLQKELKEYPDPVCQVACYDRQILYLRQIGQIERSMAYSDSILILIKGVVPETSADSSYVAHAYSSIAGSKVSQFKYKEAIDFYGKAVDYSRSLEDERYEPFFLQNMGLCYIRLAQVEKGLEYINEAFDIYNKNNDLEGKYGCADYIGTTMTDYKNYPLAKKYFRIAFLALDSLKNPGFRINLYNNLARMFNYEEKYDSSQVYFEKALDEAGKLGSDYWISLEKCNLGEVLMKKGMYFNAEKYISNAKQVFDSANFELGSFQAASLLAYIYWKRNDFPVSEKYQQEAEDILGKTEIIPNLRLDFYRRSYEIRKGLHQFERSLFFLEKYDELNDSINSTLLTWKVNELESRLFISMKESQLYEKEKELLKAREEKYLILTVAAVVVLFLLALLLFLAYKKRKEKQLLEVRQDLMVREHEKGTLQLQLMLIRNRLSPHLISNIFIDLRQLIEKEERERATNLLEPLSRLVLYSYVHTDSLTVTLKQELVFVSDYIEVRKCTLGSQFSWQIIAPDNISETRVPSMIVQLFVENAIRHGLLAKEGEKRLFIGVSDNGPVTEIEIRDNGIGRQKAKDMETGGTGMGFFLMEKLAGHLNAQNKESIRWQVDDLRDEEGKAAGTRIRITIPKIYHYQLQ
ncbi:MAG: histidine kinase [Mangrovibacterium sp.]